VLPGLIDCHTHLVADCTFGGLERAGGMTDEETDAVIVESLRAHAAAGVTTVRDLGDIRYRTLELREVQGLPRLVASGPPITTPTGHCHFLGGAVGGLRDADLRAAAAERTERGVDVIKVMASGGFATPQTDQLGAQLTSAQLDVLVDEAHGAGLPWWRTPTHVSRWRTRWRPAWTGSSTSPASRPRRIADRRRCSRGGGAPGRVRRPHHGQRPQSSRADARAAAARGTHGSAASTSSTPRGSVSSPGFASTPSE
jgi:hypothetical protein